MYCLRLRRLVLIFVNPLYFWESVLPQYIKHHIKAECLPHFDPNPEKTPPKPILMLPRWFQVFRGLSGSWRRFPRRLCRWPSSRNCLRTSW
ncbi:hypothetical protein E4W17_09815 [Neisseria meningitidis]|nr:hypothetical protein [Neisseria meningitidis]